MGKVALLMILLILVKPPKLEGMMPKPILPRLYAKPAGRPLVDTFDRSVSGYMDFLSLGYGTETIYANYWSR